MLELTSGRRLRAATLCVKNAGVDYSETAPQSLKNRFRGEIGMHYGFAADRAAVLLLHCAIDLPAIIYTNRRAKCEAAREVTSSPAHHQR